MTEEKPRYTVRAPKTIDLHVEVVLGDNGQPVGIECDEIDPMGDDRPITWLRLAELALVQSFNVEEYIGFEQLEVDSEFAEYTGPEEIRAAADRAARKVQATIDRIDESNRRAAAGD